MYKYYLCFFSFCMLYHIAMAQNVAIGATSPAASAKLDVSSTTSGFLAPRMTTAQRDAIPDPAAGLMIVNTSTNSIEFFDGTSWLNLALAIKKSSRIKLMLGGSLSENPYSIQQTSDKGYIIAGSTISSGTGTLAPLPGNGGSDFLIIKLDAAGQVSWQKIYGGSNTDICRSIIQNADGTYVAVGYSSSSNSGSLLGVTTNGGADNWLIKLDANGAIIWQKLLGGTGLDDAWVLSATADGGYIMGGNSSSSNTGTLAGINNNGTDDYHVTKLDAAGNIQWQKLLGGSASDNLRDIRQAPDGGYILAGYTSSSNTGTLTGLVNSGNEDAWVIKLDVAGNIGWQKILGGSLYDQLTSIALNSDGSCVLAGGTNSSNTGTLAGINSNGGYDYWIVKLDATGITQWQKLFGGSVDEAASSIVKTSEGGWIATGYSTSSNTGNLAGFVNGGSTDAWVTKLDGSGNLQWQKLIGGTLADGAVAIRQTDDAGFILLISTSSSNTGAFSGLFNNGNSDIMVLKMDSNGSYP